MKHARKTNGDDTSNKKADAGVGLGGLLQGLGGFIDLVSKLAEEGQSIERTGELGDEKTGKKAVYGFSVRMGAPGKPHIEPFGNVIKKGEKGPIVEEAREPMIDIFDEEGHVLVIAELPGVDEKDIRFEIDGDSLSLTARRGDRKYAKEIDLPAHVTEDGAQIAYRNGVFELKLKKKEA